ncbi:MAG: hypothetical protein HZA54_11065 [Planctomycetes bacterium]|nr:hypothetical protein [Planctomycetota bacterium]
MLCQKCEKAPATVYVMEMVGRRVRRKAHLCAACSDGAPVSGVRGRLPAVCAKGSVNPYAVSSGRRRSAAIWTVGMN